MRSKYSLVLANIFVIFLTSCDSSKDIPSFLTQVQNEVSTWIDKVTGKPSPQVSPSPVAKSDSNLPMSDEEYSSAAARNAKANAEILHEIFQVVYVREPKDRAEFGNWVDTLNQGASLEGVYNGLTHSSEYRKMEALHSGASPEAVRVFAEELALLEIELSVPTEFDASSASPLPYIGGPDLSDSAGVNSNISGMEKQVQPSAIPSVAPTPRELAAKYLKQFIGASIFTLKRVIGDEALKVVASKSQYREKLAIWYSKWVARIAQRNVDFGIPLRNKSDEAFHYKWAVESPEDRVKWEVLNRLHRLLNDANKQKQ